MIVMSFMHKISMVASPSRCLKSGFDLSAYS